MGDWLLGLPVFAMSAVILLGVYLFTAAVYAIVTTAAVGDRARAFKAVSPGMLPPLSLMFALLVGFLAAQVWSESDRATVSVNREASALRSAVILASVFPGEPEHRIRNLVRQHIEDAATHEWPAMAAGGASLTIIPSALAGALRYSLSLDPKSEGQKIAQRELVASFQNALDARRQRVLLSRSSINGVKWTCVLLQAALTLIAIALIHSDNRAANRMILGIFATAAGVAVILLATHSRPFTGEISVRPTVLLQVMPEGGP
jgi:Protein of unknown function (DUF4239)